MAFLLKVPENLNYENDEDQDFHLGRRCLRIMQKYSERFQQINITDHTAETHGSIRTKSIRLAQELRTRGIKNNDVILICSTNNSDVCAPFIAGLYLGAPIFSITENLTERELEYYFNLTTPRIVFCNHTQAERINAVAQKNHLTFEIVIFGKNESCVFTPFADLIKPTGNEDEFCVTELNTSTTSAVIILSSGSTGLPKGICLTHEQISHLMDLPIRGIDPDLVAQEVILNFSSLFWVSGTVTLLLSCLLGQTHLYTPAPYSLELAFAAIEQYKPTTFITSAFRVPDIINYLKTKNDNFSLFSIKLFLVLGNLLPLEVKNDLKKHIPNGVVKNAYGFTEACGPVTTSPPGCDKLNSVGIVLPWIQWKLVDIETEEEITEPHCPGELWVKGPTIFKRYYENPEANKNAFTADGYFKTGDALYFDEENYMYFVDRCKEMFKYNEYKISPVEIEHTIISLKDVDQVCVVGKRSPDGYRDLPLAFIQKSPGSSLTAQDIKDFVKKNLSDHKQLRGGVVFLDEIHLTHNGKINRSYINSIKNSVIPE